MKQLRASLLGEQTAENDLSLLLSNFIETPEYRSIIESKDSTVVVGRRGTGKSAMFAKLADLWKTEKATHVIQIAPEDFQTITFRSSFNGFGEKYSLIRSASKIYWRYGLLMEMLSNLGKNYKVREKISQHPVAANHIKVWQATNRDILSKVAAAVMPIIKAEANMETSIGALHQKLELTELEHAFTSLLTQSGIRFFILIDRLDEGYENDEGGAAIISGAIAVSAEFNKKYSPVRVVIFQRDNMIRAVQKHDPDYTRNIEGEVLTIHWDTHQLQNLVAKRLNVAFNFKLENTQKIWDRSTANESPNRELQGIDGFKKCLQFTLYRPRDLLSLLNQAFFNAGREGRNVIVLGDIEKTAKTISNNRLINLAIKYKC
ncbi:P-loop ATPase, Sll1717 family [Sphaerotilus microaerophilus]|nr:hypothetical protein [Sphaerotilus sp. FB-5]